VDDTGNTFGGTGTLALNTLTGLGLANPVGYSFFEEVRFTLGTGDDTLTLSGGSAAYTTVNAGGGTNVIN